MPARSTSRPGRSRNRPADRRRRLQQGNQADDRGRRDRLVVGDSFVVRVGITYPDDYLFAGLNPAATDGTQKAVGISIYRVVTTPGSTVKSPIITRNAVVSGKSLTWPVGITAAHQAEGIEQLRKLGILVR